MQISSAALLRSADLSAVFFWAGSHQLPHPSTPFSLLLGLVLFDCSHFLEEMGPRDEFANISIICLLGLKFVSPPRPWAVASAGWEADRHTHKGLSVM